MARLCCRVKRLCLFRDRGDHPLRVVIELRHVPRYRVMDYLIQAGGTPSGFLEVEGDGWSASLEALEPHYLGTVPIARDRLVLEGEPRHVERVSAFIRLRVGRRAS
jgi:hypothetical protein